MFSFFQAGPSFNQLALRGFPHKSENVDRHFPFFLGMEAIWKVEVENFPAFLVVDDKGNDFFKEWQTE